MQFLWLNYILKVVILQLFAPATLCVTCGMVEIGEIMMASKQGNNQNYHTKISAKEIVKDWTIIQNSVKEKHPSSELFFQHYFNY